MSERSSYSLSPATSPTKRARLESPQKLPSAPSSFISSSAPSSPATISLDGDGLPDQLYVSPVSSPKRSQLSESPEHFASAPSSPLANSLPSSPIFSLGENESPHSLSASPSSSTQQACSQSPQRPPSAPSSPIPYSAPSSPIPLSNQSSQLSAASLPSSPCSAVDYQNIPENEPCLPRESRVELSYGSCMSDDPDTHHESRFSGCVEMQGIVPLHSSVAVGESPIILNLEDKLHPEPSLTHNIHPVVDLHHDWPHTVDCEPTRSIHVQSEPHSTDEGNSFSESEESGSSDWNSQGSESSHVLNSESEIASDADNSDMESKCDSSSEGEESEISNIPLKLYSGSEHSVDEAVLDLLQNYLNNKETQKSLKDHLASLDKYLPQPNNLPKTLYQLQNYVRDLAPSYNVIEYMYCGHCSSLTPENLESNICDKCGHTEKNKFYGFSIEEQIRHYFEVFRIYELYKTHENNDTSGIIRDICNGSEYRRVHEPLFAQDGIHNLNEKYPITLMLNTDGVSQSKSSKTSLYPLQYVICELPPELRHCFMIVCGVWCAKESPIMNIFLKPYFMQLASIYDKGGVSWTHPVTKSQMLSVLVAPLFCADAPVRAEIQNIKSHMGKYSCNTCEQKKKKIPLTIEEEQLKALGKKIKRKNCFIYSENPARLRSKNRMEEQALKACATKSSVKGVKGPSVVSLCSYIDVSTCVVAEYMHLVCLGVVKLFLYLWFFVPGPWNISSHINEIDEFLSNITPPSFIGRLPRGVSEFKNWKASEFRAWLLYYSLPAVQKFLPECFVQHWMLLVMAVYLLLQEEILPEHINMADTLIKLFVRDVGTLYRLKDNVYNTHGLLHLPLQVSRWGPLWATSAFQFEDYNGVLSKLIHGSKNVGKELMNNLRLAHGIGLLRLKIIQSTRDVPQTGPTSVLLSECQPSLLSDKQMSSLENHNITENFKVYSRLRISKKEVFTSQLYVREKKRNNYNVEFRDDSGHLSYGEIQCFVHKDNTILVLLRALKVMHSRIILHENSRLKVNHIVPVESSDDFFVLSHDSLERKVIRVGDYICRIPNPFERNL